MDQEKIGRFIAVCRKEQHLTQAQLAEKLGISDRAVSKWETGRSMPDASIMQQLCEELGITVNDLFSGRRTDMTIDNYKAEAEKNLLVMKKKEEEHNCAMLRLEMVIAVISTAQLILVIACAAGNAVNSAAWQAGMIISGTVIFFAGMHSSIKIEREAGYYECAECGHRYIPTLGAVYMAPHMGRTRRMKCPECGKVSWQPKKLTKD